ncbi:hypothetical protein [Halioxenophilus sp. WMMB6]|uniref:hypothetical protein n=1 Tax=Halioxenophilus sp. WMMB6 TaxID=3073815 RepID=UPI00295E9D68|nr:hypothetical protein [Halioxenophilus sp. WMMB6]
MSEINIDKIHQQRQQLVTQIAHLEQTLSDLKGKLAELEALEQHEAVDHLEEYLVEADERYSHLKDFGDMLLNDLKKLLHHS